MSHDGFSVLECLSECVEFYPGAFDAANPRKGGVFQPVPPDHDATDEVAAYKLADASFPGYFGIFYRANRPTKNALETKINTTASAPFNGLKDWQILQKSFTRMK
jgi:2-oxoglutarate/2-oxoacid ferredoxin oxidoreductase subunit beta